MNKVDPYPVAVILVVAAITCAILAIVFFSGRKEPSTAAYQEFTVVRFNASGVKIKHVKTGACWIAYGRGLAQAPKEVCND